jgi:hypothetical protein
MARTSADAVRRIGIRLSALAQDGLTYAADDCDRDRYRQLSQLAAGLLAAISGRPAGELAVELGRDPGYATPKADVRGVIFDDSERVLLMRERADGRWSLPGGWADPRGGTLGRGHPGDPGGNRVPQLGGQADRLPGPRAPGQPAAPAGARLQAVLPVPPRRRRAAARGTGDVRRRLVRPRLAPAAVPGPRQSRQLERALAHHRNPSLPSEFD